MQTVQTIPQRFDFQSTLPLSRTLDDYRMMHVNYGTGGSFSAQSMRPALITALVIAAVGGLAMWKYSDTEHTAEKANAAVTVPDPSVPATASVPATRNVPLRADAPTAKDSPTTDPLKTMTKSEEANSMPLAGQGNNHSSESLNPVKAKSSVAAKSAPIAAKKAAPIPRPMEVTPQPSTPAPEAVVPTPPAPAPAPVTIDEKPVLPTPAPMVPPPEPTKP